RHHLLGGALLYAVGHTVAPDVIGKDALVARLDPIADRLADTMIAQDRRRQIVPPEQVELLWTIVRVAEGALHLEMIAPASQVEPLIAPFAGFLGQLIKGQIRPLTGK